MKRLMKCTKCSRKPELVKQKNGKKFYRCAEGHLRVKQNKSTKDTPTAMSRWNVLVTQALNPKPIKAKAKKMHKDWEHFLRATASQVPARTRI